MKIKAKLILGFALVALLTIAVGVTGIVGLRSTNDTYNAFSSEAIAGVTTLADLREAFQQQRIILRTLMVDIGDSSKVGADISDLRAYEAAMKKAMLAYEETIFDPTAETDYFAFKEAYEGGYSNAKEKYITAISRGDSSAAVAALAEGGQAAQVITKGLAGVMGYVDQAVKEQSTLAGRSTQGMSAVLVVVMLLTAVAAIALGAYISAIIGKPLGHMSDALTQIGSTGNLQLREETARSASAEINRKDEIGKCARACVGLIQHLHSLEQTLDHVARGDLSVEVKVLSEEDNIGRSVSRVVESMNSMFGEIHASTVQVAVGSRQIADGSQALSEGTAEQAAATEELSVSVSEIAKNTAENARLASNAAALAEEIKKKADQSSRQMSQMMTAVQEIGDASHSIGKVISVIDDIAFQTNILALNAAVEAARAGQHGKGFAVVAEEVRGLAAKSAAAAKDTGNLIENSITKAGLGVQIAGETAESMTEIIASINESDKLIREIALSSEKQSQAVAQINRGIDQVAQVIQQNSATAQESASSSEEMSEQAGALEAMMTRFKLKAGDVR